MFGADNVPLFEKPDNWLVLAKSVKSICRIVRVQVKNQITYDARSVVCPLDTRRSGRHNWLQMFYTHFPSEKLVIYFLFIQFINLFVLYFYLL